MPHPNPKPPVRAAYLTRAAEHFLSGLDFPAPAATVETGTRTAQQWCEELRRSRAEAGLPEARPRGGEAHDPGDLSAGEVSARGAAD